MLQTVIAKMITKWTFGFILPRIHFAGNYKIGICADTISILVNIPETPVTQHTGKCHFTDSLRKRHHRTYAMGWWSAGKYTYPQRQTFFIGFVLVHTNAPVQLVM